MVKGYGAEIKLLLAREGVAAAHGGMVPGQPFWSGDVLRFPLTAGQ
jgi:hypothetical protein